MTKKSASSAVVSHSSQNQLEWGTQLFSPPEVIGLTSREKSIKSQPLGMTKWGFALPCNVVADGWVDRKSSGNLISCAPTRLNLFNKIHRRKPYLPLIWTALAENSPGRQSWGTTDRTRTSLRSLMASS